MVDGFDVPVCRYDLFERPYRTGSRNDRLRDSGFASAVSLSGHTKPGIATRRCGNRFPSLSRMKVSPFRMTKEIPPIQIGTSSSLPTNPQALCMRYLPPLSLLCLPGRLMPEVTANG